MNHKSWLILAALALGGTTGCTWVSSLGNRDEGFEYGKTFFVGGAGAVGNVVGTFDVPNGLRKGGYKGAIEVYAWQAVVGGTLRDQVDRGRNEEQARKMAGRIQDYELEHPGRPVNIIALSAGTGIAAWALESLPSKYHVQNVVFLSSSLSREYDLGAALERVDGRLYVFTSTNDPILRYMVPMAGSVDRDANLSGAAGLEGFVLPANASPLTTELYRRKLRHYPYKDEYARYGYIGMHADSTAPDFIAHVVTPLIRTAP